MLPSKKQRKSDKTIMKKPGTVSFYYFLSVFFKILLDQGPFCGVTDCSCFGLRVSFLMGFKSRVDLSPALFLACVR